MRSRRQDCQHVAQREKYHLWQAHASYLHKTYKPESTHSLCSGNQKTSPGFCFLRVVAADQVSEAADDRCPNAGRLLMLASATDERVHSDVSSLAPLWEIKPCHVNCFTSLKPLRPRCHTHTPRLHTPPPRAHDVHTPLCTRRLRVCAQRREPAGGCWFSRALLLPALS